MIIKNCYSRDQLQDFLLGRLSDELAEEIGTHIESCSVCTSSVSACDREDDSLIRNLRSSRSGDLGVSLSVSGEAEPSVEQACRAALDRVKSLGSRPQFDPSLARLTNGLTGMTGEPNESLHGTPNTSEGVSLGDYHLTERLGEGGMGAVYRADHQHLGREVAIKLLPLQRLRDTQAVARFQREMKAIGRLDHPAIVRATDAGEVDGTHFLVMELVDGVDLAELSGTCGPLPVESACELIRQAAVGLDHAHQLGMVHRDVKPSNLMLTVDGQVKILDLGLALLGPQGPVDELTTVGQLMGTLDYMAPEQCDNCHDVDSRADVYSLAATLYKLLAGRAPYGDSKGPLRKLKRMATDPPPPLSQLRADLPDALCEVIHRALSRDPSKRPQSSSEFSNQLSAWTTSGPDESNADQLSKLCKQAMTLRGNLPPKRSPVSTPPSETAKSHPPRWPRWPLAVALGGALLWWGIMLILQTNNGRLVIESDVDNVEVQVLKDGKDIGMQVDRGENQLTIRSGEYQLKITTPSDGVTIEPQAVRVQRGGQTIVRIRKESDDSQPLVARKDPKTKPKGPASQQPFAADPLMSAQLLLSKGPQFDNRSLGEWLRVAMQGDTVSSSTWTAMESLRDAYKQEDRRGAATQLFNLLERERSPQQMAKIGVSIVLVLGASITTEDIERVLAPIANASPKAIAAVANQPNVSRGRGNQVRFLWVDIRVAEMIAQLPKEKRTPTIQRLLNEGPSVMRRSCLAYFQRTVEPRFTEPTDVTAYYRPFAEALVKASLDESPEVRQMSWSLLKYHSTHLDSTRERAVAMLKDPDKSLAYDAALVLAKHWPKTDGLADFCMKRLDDNAVAMIESLRLLAAHQPRLAPMIIERYSVVAPPQNFWDGELIRVLISMKPPATESLRKLLEQLAQPTDQELAGEDSFDAARSASMSGMLSGNPAEWVALAVAADEGLLALYGKPMPKRYRGYTQEVWLARLLKIDPASARTLTDLRRVSEGLRATRTDEFELTIAESLLRRKDPVTSSISDRRSSSYARSVFDSIMKEVPVEALAKTLRKIWGEDNVPNEILLRSIKALEVHTDSHNVDQLWPGLLKLVKSNDEAVFQNAAVVAADLAADNEAMGDVGELIDVLFSMLDDPDRADDCSNLLVDLHIEKYKTFDEILATSNARLLGHLLLTSSTTEPQLLEILDSLDSVKERDRESLLLAGIKRLKDLSNTAEAVSRLRAMSVSGSPEVRSRATQVLSTLRPPPKRFDGKTIDEWFGLLSVELKFEARNSAISAISALAGYDDRANDAFAALLAAGEGVNLNATVSSSTKIIPPLAYGCVRIAAPQSLMMLEKVMAKDPAAPLPLAVLFFEREMSRSDEQGTPLGTTFAADPERFARIQQVLLKLCQHEHDHVRMRAVVALADPLSKEARSTLAELLNHKNPQLNLLCAKRLFEQNAPSPELVSWFGTHLSALANSKPSGMELNVPHAGRPQPVFPLQNWCLQNVDQLGAKGTPLAQVLQQIAARAERRSRLHRVSPDESNLFSQTDSNVVELRGEMEIQMMAKGALAAIGVEVQGDLQE